MFVFNEGEINKVLQKCISCKCVFCCEKIDMFISNKKDELLYLVFKFNEDMYLECPLKRFVFKIPKNIQQPKKILEDDKFNHIVYLLKKYKGEK